MPITDLRSWVFACDDRTDPWCEDDEYAVNRGDLYPDVLPGNGIVRTKADAVKVARSRGYRIGRDETVTCGHCVLQDGKDDDE